MAQMAELLGQAELRQMYQARTNANLTTSTSASSSAVVTKRKTAPSAWNTELERYQPNDNSAMSSTVVSKLLSQHTEDIRSIRQSIGGLSEKVEQQGTAIANMVTLSQIQTMMKALLDGKAAEN